MRYRYSLVFLLLNLPDRLRRGNNTEIGSRRAGEALYDKFASIVPHSLELEVEGGGYEENVNRMAVD